MDAGAWLRGLGLGRYERAFRDNDIDASLLPTLTSDDPRELGVASLGHRERLLAATAALAGAPDPPLALTVPRAEWRQLSVMFAEFVGSTSAPSSASTADGTTRAGSSLVLGPPQPVQQAVERGSSSTDGGGV